MGGPHKKLLAVQLKELSSLELDFSLEATGFEMGEIDLRIGNAVPGGHEDKDDSLPLEALQRPVNQPGDLWALGPHRVHCGSALESGAFDLLMKGEQAAMVFTDPPYNVPIDGHVSGLGAVKHREFAMASGEMRV